MNKSCLIFIKCDQRKLPRCLSGFIADKSGNYTAAFLMAGAGAIIAFLIPFFLLCVKRESHEHTGRRVVGQSGNVAGGDLKQSGKDELELTNNPKTSGEDELELTNNPLMINRAPLRPASAIVHMESSI